MPIWITAIGIGCIGVVHGYLTFYSFRRHQPPLTEAPLPLNQVLLLLGTVGTSGAIGSMFIALEGINYFGPYGIGFLLGVAMNVFFTMHEEGWWKS